MKALIHLWSFVFCTVVYITLFICGTQVLGCLEHGEGM